jgi:antimicrobial peptide system SdpB family protein
LSTSIFLLVAIGFAPRWTSVPHWYISFSFANDCAAIQGGDRIAEIVTLLLIPLCVCDSRVWTWSARPELKVEWFRGSSYAAQMVLRFQVFLVYANSVVGKLRFKPWRDGSALRNLAENPAFGAPMPLRSGAVQILCCSYVSDFLTWSVLFCESCIAVLVLCDPPCRRGAVLLGTVLHLSILLLMGLFSFSLIMIATLMIIAAGYGSARDTRRSRPGRQLLAGQRTGAVIVASAGSLRQPLLAD